LFILKNNLMNRFLFFCFLLLNCLALKSQTISEYLGSPRSSVKTRGMHIIDTALHIGYGDSSGAPIARRLQSVFTTAHSGGPSLSGMFRANQTAATPHSIQGVEGYTKTSHASGTVTLSIGTIGNVEHSGAGILLMARSIQAGGILSGNGTIRDAIPVNISPIAITGTGTITNSHGLLVGIHSAGKGTITNKYNIRTLDSTGKNLLRGSMEMPDLIQNALDTSTYKLVVTDANGGLKKMYWPTNEQQTINGGQAKLSTTQSGPAYTVEADKSVVFVNYKGGAATITLPAGTLDREITIKNLNTSNKVTVSGMSSDDSNSIAARGAVTVKYDGTAWVAISKY
jgi:hypothetical protein